MPSIKKINESLACNMLVMLCQPRVRSPGQMPSKVHVQLIPCEDPTAVRGLFVTSKSDCCSTLVVVVLYTVSFCTGLSLMASVCNHHGNYVSLN